MQTVCHWICFAANSAEFAALDESKVDVKEMFIHRWVESQVYRWCRASLVHGMVADEPCELTGS